MESRGVGVREREKEHGLKKKSQRERVCNEKLLRRENDDNNKRRKLHSAPRSLPENTKAEECRWLIDCWNRFELECCSRLLNDIILNLKQM
jgi:hypothetical protein